MIDETLKASHENTVRCDSQDVAKRGELMSERHEWREQLAAMDALDEEMKRNMADLKQRLTAFNGEIDKMVEETRNTEPPKAAAKGKKAKKAKPKKSKISKPTTDVSLPQDVPKLTEQCMLVEKAVPAWRYANHPDECNL